MKRKPIYAISKSEKDINRILIRLFHSGESSCDISILPPHGSATGHIVSGRGAKLFRPAIVGACLGGLAGVVIGILEGLDSSTIPDLLSVAGGTSGVGALGAALLGVTATGSHAAKTIRKWLSPCEPEATLSRIPEGSYLIAIRPASRRDESRVKRILTEGGVEEIPVG